MKKIGIITINDYNNYGNRLQCYAVQKYLENLGYKPENIYNRNSYNGFIMKNARKLYHFINDIGNIKTVSERKKNFLEFNKNIKFSNEAIICGRHSKDLDGKYDYFVTGSDQVWNPFYRKRVEVDLLYFASPAKRVAFSASMGVSDLPNEVKDKYKYYLSGFKSISVREDSAKKIAEALTGRKDIEVLADPTLLLTANEWSKIAQKLDFDYNQRYIVSYFLGGSKKYESVIKGIAEKYSCEIIDIYDKNNKYYACGPQHFLDLEKNAFLVCTDSFHSSVFAFLFNRPFILFDRYNTKIDMNSRMETFLSTFALKDRLYKSDGNTEDYLAWEYSKGYEILEQKREEAKSFLLRAFSD